MMKTKLQDWINIVNQSQIRKKIHGLIFKYSDKSILSVKNPNHSFIKEKARNIIQKLRKNLLNITELDEREKKLNQIAHKNIRGNAILATSKLKPTAHSNDAVIPVPTFDQRITAKADAFRVGSVTGYHYTVYTVHPAEEIEGLCITVTYSFAFA